MPFLRDTFPNHGTVFVKKRSPLEREAICAVLGWANLQAHPVETIAEMLALLDQNNASCLVTDLPETIYRSQGLFEGLTWEELEQPVEPGGVSPANSHTLVICSACLTEAGCTFQDENMAFLSRPYSRGQLLEAISHALHCDLSHQEQSTEQDQILSMIGKLNSRERHVMRLIYDGMPNKLIANQLKLSMRTVEAARSSLFKKMKVDSAIMLVRILATVDYEARTSISGDSEF